MTFASNGVDQVTGRELAYRGHACMVLPASSESYEYDGTGRLEADSLWNYTWNGMGRLVSMQRKAGTSPDPELTSETIAFVYDADGHRTLKTRTRTYEDAPDKVETSKVYWSDWLPVCEEISVDGGTASRRWFVWGQDVSGSWDGAGGIGGLLAIQEEGGRTLLPVHDGLGNITALIHAGTGDTVATYDYAPFGEIVAESGEVNACPFRYQSKFYDVETGLSYFGFRYYSAKLGRWISRDPLGEEGGFNLYGYCGNDPVNRWDYLGMSPNGYRGKAMIRAHVKNKKQRDAMLGEFDDLWNESRPYAYIGPALLLAPAAIAVLPEAYWVGGGLVLRASVALETSAAAKGTVSLLGAYHAYNYVSDPAYRAETVSLDAGTGFSSVGFAIRDVYSTTRGVLAAPRLNPKNYDWKPFFEPFRGGYSYTGISVPGVPKFIRVGPSGHHVPAVRKAFGRPFEVGRGDKVRPTIFSRANDPGHDHWRLHNAEREFVGPRQGAFEGTDEELFEAYRKAYAGLEDIRVDVRSPDGTHVLGTDVSPQEAVDLIENWLKQEGLLQ